jgi:hypothetical protein
MFMLREMVGEGKKAVAFSNPAPPHEKPQAWAKSPSYSMGAVALLFFGGYCFLD